MAPRQTRDAELIRTARKVLQLQRAIAKRRREIKKLAAELKHERRMLRGLAYAADNRPDIAPSRLTGGATGYALPPADIDPETLNPEYGTELSPDDAAPVSDKPRRKPTRET